eukprot:gnl/MRDRNA2_/MRDRNA2_117184_c0_seq1.p1 gnl/MRDRNA2_/MRDRNA2_117184_c0~~gnl/MRDRNA2_/MRDRNA2_117184_c0_seq1.p1  ORF type:complete len:632 (-),score=103.87 gnl/MRDRNA2_/MRDRNA2_117184_c0_seq1:46-1941(-)
MVSMNGVQSPEKPAKKDGGGAHAMHSVMIDGGAATLRSLHLEQLEHVEQLFLKHQEHMEYLIACSQDNIRSAFKQMVSEYSWDAYSKPKDFNPCAGGQPEVINKEFDPDSSRIAGSILNARPFASLHESPGVRFSSDCQASLHEPGGMQRHGQNTNGNRDLCIPTPESQMRTPDSPKTADSRKSFASGKSKTVENLMNDIEKVQNDAAGKIKAKGRQNIDHGSGKHPSRRYADRFIDHKYFNNGMALVIFFNAVIIGVQTNYHAQHLDSEEPAFFGILGYMFAFVFTVELVLKLWAQGASFFTSDDWKWNWFDFVVVSSAIVEIGFQISQDASGFSGGTALRAVRVLRLVRSIRAIRVMRCFRELRLVVHGIMSSLSSLFWLLVLLTFIMFIFAVFITQQVTEYRSDCKAKTELSDCMEVDSEQFSSMLLVFYALYKAISGGQSWGEIADPLFSVSPFVGLLFTAYISFSVLAVLNVVTGVFVDNAQKAASQDREHMVMEESADRMRQIKQVQEMFKEADIDGTGQLSREEFENHVDDPRVQAYFRLLHIDLHSYGAENLFNMLDFDGGGEMDSDEFVVGCTKLRGNAKNLDLAVLHHEVKKQEKKFTAYFDDMKDMLEALAPRNRRRNSK